MTQPIKLLLIAGARPNFMKIAPVIREISRRKGRFRHVLVHTGQHYDEGMSEVFFRDLGIPAPDHHLNVGSGSHAQQTALIMTKLEPVLVHEKPACVVVFGDVNSTLAGSVVAKKMNYPVAHVEAGLRSGDRTMPEEINRIVTDSISDIFYVTESSGHTNLLREGHPEASIAFVGHVMIDNLYYELEQISSVDDSSQSGHGIQLPQSEFGIVTLHRPANVDDRDTLRGIAEALNEVAQSLKLIFPVHPRTRLKLAEFNVELADDILLTGPLGYREFLSIWRHARLILTDSGGMQEESTALGIPCLTLRENTERPVTVEEGTNRLVGTDPQRIVAEARRILAGAPVQMGRPRLWDGNAAVRIIDDLERRLS
jgi:UDP-N-acetylglucosamine 2-epimerase (non-hydrolysing)